MPTNGNAQLAERFPDLESEDFTYIAERSMSLAPAVRAMIAARFGGLAQGQNQKSKVLADRPAVTLAQLSKAFCVSDGIITRARTILRHGTPEDIEQIESGKCGVSEIVVRIRRERRMSAGDQIAEPKTARGPRNRGLDSHQNRRIQGEIWKNLRDALYGLTSLPRVDDVLSILTGGGKTRVVDEQLPKALKFLQELHDERTKRSAKVSDRKNRKDSADS